MSFLSILQDPYFCCAVEDILAPIPEESIITYPVFTLTAPHEADAWAGALLEPDDIIELRLIPSRQSQDRLVPLRHCPWKTTMEHRLNLFPRASAIGLQPGKLIDLNSGKEPTWWGQWRKEEKKWIDIQAVPGVPLSVYAGPNPRIATGETRNDGVLLARALWVDFDAVTEGEARCRLKGSGLPRPTLLIHSGNGIHAYWRLEEPLWDLAKWTFAQKHLIGLMGSDPAIHDPARVMRLPGFGNPKTCPANPCRILECEPGHRYSLRDLVKTRSQAKTSYPGKQRQISVPLNLGSQPNESILARAAAYADSLIVPTENRNSTLFSYGCMLVEKFGLGAQDLVVILSQVNARSLNTLDDSELAEIAAKAARHMAAKPQGILLTAPINDRVELPVLPVMPLADWRKKMVEARLSSLGTVDSIYFDGSTTGVGKSTADIEAMKAAESSVTYLPTHQACRELVVRLREEGLDAEAYPRLDESTCALFGDEKVPGPARQAMVAGVSVGEAVCATCTHASTCEFQNRRERARSAAHLVATHDRGGCSDLVDAEGKRVVFIHEEATKILRRMRKVSSVSWRKGEGHLADLQDVMDLCATAKRVAQSWNDPAAESFVEILRITTEEMIDLLQSPIGPDDPVVDIIATKATKTITNLDTLLFRAMQRSGIWPHGGVMRLVMGHATGGLESLCLVQEKKKAGKDFRTRRSLTATWKVDLPQGPTYWFEDATGNPGLISWLTGRQVKDMTPQGNLDYVRKPQQVASMDVAKSTSGAKVRSLVRGLMAQHKDRRKIGIITHLCHLSELRKLEPIFLRRILKMEHYRSGQDRASNSWLACDLILVLGTPRVPPEAIRDRLIETGLVATAGEDGRFASLTWTTKDSSGEERSFTGTGYAHPDWANAYRQMVRDNIVQAVGRGRGVTGHGVDVMVVTTEPLGIPVEYRSAPSLIDDPAGCVLGAVSANHPNYKTLGDLAETTMMSARSLSRHVKALTDAGLLIRSTRRGPVKVADSFL